LSSVDNHYHFLKVYWNFLRNHSSWVVKLHIFQFLIGQNSLQNRIIEISIHRFLLWLFQDFDFLVLILVLSWLESRDLRDFLCLCLLFLLFGWFGLESRNFGYVFGFCWLFLLALLNILKSRYLRNFFPLLFTRTHFLLSRFLHSQNLLQLLFDHIINRMLLKNIPFNKIEVKKLSILCYAGGPALRYFSFETLCGVFKKTWLLFKIDAKVKGVLENHLFSGLEVRVQDFIVDLCVCQHWVCKFVAYVNLISKISSTWLFQLIPFRIEPLRHIWWNHIFHPLFWLLFTFDSLLFQSLHIHHSHFSFCLVKLLLVDYV